MTRIRFFFVPCLFLFIGRGAVAAPVPPVSPQKLDASPSFDIVERRAFDFFWNESDSATGLSRDRAHNTGDTAETNTIASTAATGYALAALPVGVSHAWISKQQGYERALTTLRFIHDKLPNEHGFYFHFVDATTGARRWNSELSSIDTALLLMGAQVAACYWPETEVARLADELTERADWPWMQTDAGTKLQETAPAMGWKPESGFLPYRWQGYSEAFLLYCLALGSQKHPLQPSAWDSWSVSSETLEGHSPVYGGPKPLFMAQMASGFFDVRDLRDRQGRDWWASWRNSHLVDQAYCARNPQNRQSYAQGFWGLSANDLPPPVGYGANSPADGKNDGTVAPAAMLAGVTFTPDVAQAALANLWQKHGSQLWGRYGFSDAFNADKDWYDTDVIGIDLGMMLLSIENAHSGLVWRLLRADPVTKRGLAAAGFHRLPQP